MPKAHGPRNGRSYEGFVSGTAEPRGRSRQRTGMAGDAGDWAVDGRSNPDGPEAVESDADALEGRLEALAGAFRVEGEGAIDRRGRILGRGESGRFAAGRLQDDQAVRVYLEGVAFGLSLAGLAERFGRDRGTMSRARARGRVLVEGAKDRLRDEAAW